MKLLVCIKAVKSKYVNSNLKETERFVINPYDLFSLHKAVKLKNEYTQVTCLCMGAREVTEILYKCIALGADDAILLSDPQFAGSDTYATSYILERAIDKIEHDFIICGNRSVDGETGQVVYGLAARKHYFCINNASDMAWNGEMGLKVETIINQRKDTISIKSPAIIAFNNFISDISVSLFALKKAQRKQIVIWGKDDINCDMRYIGQAGSKTKVKKIKNIAFTRSSMFMDKITCFEAMQFLLKEMENIKINME